MKLYLTQAGRWAGTQADARVDGRFDQIEVPTDKPGLIAWLNEQQRGAFPGSPQLSMIDEAGPVTQAHVDAVVAKPTPAPQQPPAQSPNWKADSVMDWLLNEATTAQVEQLFARIGTRFHEANRV